MPNTYTITYNSFELPATFHQGGYLLIVIKGKFDMKSIFFKGTNNLVSRLVVAIRGLFFRGIRGCLFSIIRGLRAANLDCRGRLCVTSGNDICCLGRSMIEMLGVLAIIGVLSVGGIAGYSKAMEKFKLNKTINEYSYLIYGILEHLDDLRSVPVGMGKFNFTDFARAINIVPPSWTVENNMAMWDNSGNIVQAYSGGTYSGGNALLLDFYLGGWQETADSKISANFSPKLCVEMFNNIMTPLHSAVYSINTFNSTKGDITFYGDAYCSNGRMCLSNATLAQIKSAGEHCDASGICCITIRFPL